MHCGVPSVGHETLCVRQDVSPGLLDMATGDTPHSEAYDLSEMLKSVLMLTPSKLHTGSKRGYCSTTT